MTDASQQLIEKALGQLAEQQAAVVKTKQFINQLCEFDDRPPMFSDAELKADDEKPAGPSIGPDEFYTKPFATAVREILTMRKDAGTTGPASIEEIHAALCEGGFDFPSNDPEKQKQGLAVSLGKNTTTFRKLPSGLFGLADWYGAPTRPQRRGRVLDLGDENAQDDDEPEEDAEANADESPQEQEEGAREGPEQDSRAPIQGWEDK